MTVELVDEITPNVEQLLAAWLQPLGRAGQELTPADTLPFRAVNRISGDDSYSDIGDTALVSVHTYAEATSAKSALAAAAEQADITHRRIMVLARNPLTEITLPSGFVVNVDFCRCTEKAHRAPWKDSTVGHYVATYRIGLSFITP